MTREARLKQRGDQARARLTSQARQVTPVRTVRPAPLGFFADDAPEVHASFASPRAAKQPAGKMAKTQLIDMVADKTSLNKKQADEAVAVMLDSVIGALKKGQSVGLPGLGTLSVTNTAARTGVRPGTSQKITIPAGKKVRFKVASTLKGNL